MAMGQKTMELTKNPTTPQSLKTIPRREDLQTNQVLHRLKHRRSHLMSASCRRRKKNKSNGRTKSQRLKLELTAFTIGSWSPVFRPRKLKSSNASSIKLHTI